MATPDPAKTSSGAAGPGGFRFGRSRRLTHAREFQAMYRSGARQNVGALVIFSRPNGLDRPRFGMAVHRKVGKANVRNRIKRLLREAFRLEQHELASGFDYLVRVRPHEPMTLEAYRGALLEAAAKLEKTWAKRARRQAERGVETANGSDDGADA